MSDTVGQQAGDSLQYSLRTSHLKTRVGRNPDYQLESQAINELTHALAEAPREILTRLSNAAMRLCRSESAGISLILPDNTAFYWPAIVGKWTHYIGGGTPRYFGPCGVVVDEDSTQLFERPDRTYPYLVDASPPINEALVVPFHVNGVAVGTVWAVSHDPERQFDAEDARLLESLTGMAAAAYQAITAIEALDREQANFQRTEARAQTILAAMNAGLCTIEVALDEAGTPTDFVIVESNPALNRMLDDVNPVGHQLHEFMSDFSARWLPFFVRVASSGEAAEAEYWCERRQAWYEVKVRRVEYTGTPRLIALFTDITDRVAKLAAIKEEDRKKNEFLAILAHELRNPLAPISYAVKAMQAAEGDGVPNPSLEVIDRQAVQMVRLIDDLLDVSRIGRGLIELRRSVVDAAVVVRQAIESVHPLYVQLHHRLDVVLPEVPLYLDCDPARITQVVANLLTNAAKFTADGGSISVEVTRDGGMLLIRVRDNGIGIELTEQGRIFDMFGQVDSSLERSKGGLGIGLTLLRTLVELHGGTVSVQSDGAGRGSEFSVYLPAMPEAHIAATESTAQVSTSPALRILVVDDNRDAGDTLAQLLEAMGHATRTAADGFGAVTAAEEYRPDVVLLDIGLPGLNGYQVAERIRELPWGTSLSLIALTGWGQAGDRLKSKAAGFDHHFVKPVELSELMKVLPRHE